MTFYVPFPEADALTAFDTINTAAVQPISTYVSIAAIADGTVIWYDQWEDGYEKSHHLNTPVQATTQIWGDGNPVNGAPPGIADDIIRAGAVILLASTVDPASPLTLDYDARDKIVANRAIAVTRSYWAGVSSTLMAGSVETYDISKWGLDYRVPVGQDIPDGTTANAGDHQMFEYTALSVMAAEDGTAVQVDADNNGAFETTATLNEGESYFVNGGVNVGGRVVASKPVQVLMFTGDTGSNYETRDSTLLPVSLWSNSYYAPVATAGGDGTRVWLYNSGASAITVSYRYRVGAAANVTTSSVAVAAGSYASVLLTDASGTQFYTAGAPAPAFYAYSTTDSDTSTTTDNQAWDWSFTLIPQQLLTPQVLVGLGVGRDPLSATNPDENGNPIWLTTVGNGQSNATVYVDFNGDNAGPYTDPNGNRYDTSLVARELQPLKIYDPDGDQTAMLVYVLSTNVMIAAAWGQDPATASASAPGLDAGTAVPPVDVFDVSKSLALVADSDGDGQLGPGERVAYEIAVGNTSRAPVPADVIVRDALPEDTAYVAGSAAYRTSTNGAWTAIADDASGTAFPLDGGGFRIQASIPVNGSFSVRFQADVDAFASLTPGRASIVNTGSVTAVVYNRTLPFKNETYLHGSLGDRVWYDANGNGLQDAGEGGLNGVTVYLDRNANGVRDADERYATTSGDGDYLLTNALIEAGTHQVRVDRATLPSAGFIQTYDLDGTLSADEATVTLAAGQDRADADFGYRAVARLSGSVYFDVDGDGAADAEDTAGLADVTVLLLDASSNTVAATSTSAAGYYEFVNVQTGAYAVVQLLPAGYTNTLDVAGANDRRIPLTLTINQNAAGNDFYDTRAGGAAAQNKVLYLSDPGQALDRIDPVASGDATTTNTATLGSQVAGSITHAATTSASATGTSLTFSHTPGTGDNRLLLVSVVTGSTSGTGNNAPTVSGVTFGGTAMTFVGTVPDPGIRVRVYIYRMVNPPSGAANVVVSASLSAPLYAGATTYTGVSQSNPLGAFSSVAVGDASGAGGVTSVSLSGIASATGELVYGAAGVDADGTAVPIAAGGGQTARWEIENGTTASASVSTAPGASSVSLAYSWSGAQQAALGAVTIKPASGGASTVSFTQAPAFALPFSLAAGATLAVTSYVSVVSGAMPANPAVTARLSAGGATFLTLANPVYSSGSGTLVWAGPLGSAVAIAAGEAVTLSVSNAQSGVEFQIRYDSATYPSKIILPTASIIAVPSLGLYDAPYPGGLPVTDAPVGALRYIRVTATDPFGAQDVAGVNLTVDGAGTGADLNLALSDLQVVASNAWSKTYEYAWQTSAQTGDYTLSVRAYEGTEGIYASAATHAGLYSAALFGYVFVDKNADLLRNTDDSSVTNALVRLVAGGVVVASTSTDAFGYYRFDDVPVGTVSVLVSRADATLIDVPATGPAASDERRNRALPDTQGADAYISYPVVAGYGVLASMPGEQLNVGFSSYNPLSAAMDISLRATGKGGVMIELWTTEESGYADIVICAWINNAWVEVGRVPADKVVGEGSNRYKIRTDLLAADGAYYLKIVDEAGIEHYSAAPVAVETIRVGVVRLEAKTLTLTFNTEPYGTYVVLVSSDLTHWSPEQVSCRTAQGWSKYAASPFTVSGASTQVKVPASRKQAYFKIQRVDE